LALLPGATLSGSSASRGSTRDILYDPAEGGYAVKTSYNEFGVAFGENLGTVAEENAFYWMVEWAVPKAINYITFGGTYENQPQPNTAWKIEYRLEDLWVELQSGTGGWIDSGIFEWIAATEAVTADALRVKLYSDGSHDLVSIHLRARGGESGSINDSGTEPKATLVQYRTDGMATAHNTSPVPAKKAAGSLRWNSAAKQLEVHNAAGRAMVRIFDSRGRTVDVSHSTTIDCSPLSPGIYLVHYRNESNSVQMPITVIGR
jgi:hypothetical protein